MKAPILSYQAKFLPQILSILKRFQLGNGLKIVQFFASVQVNVIMIWFPFAISGKRSIMIRFVISGSLTRLSKEESFDVTLKVLHCDVFTVSPIKVPPTSFILSKIYQS